jgi:hypothetical protein
VTELSGRGIGMDVVRSEVNALGGRIETSTEAGKGTSFKLVLPLTTAVTQVVMLRTGELSIGVPANVVEIVRRATAEELQQAYNSGTFEVAASSCRSSGRARCCSRPRAATSRRARRCRWWFSEAPRSAWPCTWTKCWATRKWW